MKSLEFVIGLSKPKWRSTGVNHFTYDVDHSSFPDYVIDELGLTNECLLSLEMLKGGKIKPHKDHPSRLSHIMWLLSKDPMTVTTVHGTKVLNYSDSMVVQSNMLHSATVEGNNDSTFISVDHGKPYSQTVELYRKLTENFPEIYQK